MKTLKLTYEYNRLSRLAEKDSHLFTKLLKGGSYRRHLRELFIMPIFPESDLTCHGFAIEHHQLFVSETSGQYYLVFWPLKYRPLVDGTYRCTRYCFIDSPHQYGYICLARCKDRYVYHLDGPYSIFEC